MSVSSFAVSKRKDYATSTTTLKAIITQAAITITHHYETATERRRNRKTERERQKETEIETERKERCLSV